MIDHGGAHAVIEFAYNNADTLPALSHIGTNAEANPYGTNHDLVIAQPATIADALAWHDVLVGPAFILAHDDDGSRGESPSTTLHMYGTLPTGHATHIHATIIGERNLLVLNGLGGGDIDPSALLRLIDPMADPAVNPLVERTVAEAATVVVPVPAGVTV